MKPRQPAHSRLALFAGLLVCSLANCARAQSFFGGGALAFDPEISTVQSGAVLDAQVVVSDDRKYVTIGAQFSESRLLALRDFPVAGPATQGFVGGVNPLGGDTGGTSGGGNNNSGGGFSASANGGANATANATAARVNARSRTRRAADQPLPMPSASPTEIDRRAVAARSVLGRPGMFLLQPLN